MKYKTNRRSDAISAALYVDYSDHTVNHWSTADEVHFQRVATQTALVV